MKNRQKQSVVCASERKLSADQGGFPVRGVRQGYLPATVTGVDRRQAVAHERPIARCCKQPFFNRDRDHRTPRTKPSGERFHDGTFWFTMLRRTRGRKNREGDRGMNSGDDGDGEGKKRRVFCHHSISEFHPLHLLLIPLSPSLKSALCGSVVKVFTNNPAL